MRASLAAFWLFSSACRGPAAPPPPSSPPPPDPHIVARDEARLVLEKHCAECHTEGFSTALPGALRVFNLVEPEWQGTMSDLQLKDAQERLQNDMGPQGKLGVTDEERRVFDRFVELELTRRAGQPNARSMN